MKMKKLVIAIFVTMFVASCSKNDDKPQTVVSIYDKPLTQAKSQRLKFVLDSVCNAMQIKGVSASIYIPNKGLWEGSYGFSHANVPINSAMALTIGSNTKTYIAALILKLQENGKLNLNDKVINYVPNAPFINNTTTIKQLLNHTTGFGDFSFNQDFIAALFVNFNRVWQPVETYQYFEAPIGVQGSFSYSDQNYLIAGLVIEAATNKSVKDNMRELILNPAGLSKTVYYPFEQTNLTIPHSWTADFGTSFRDIDAEGYSRVAFCSADNAAGGMLSTAKENAIFWDKLMNGKIINQTSLNLMKTFVPAPTNQSLYGLGLQKTVNAYNNRDIYAHNGYVPGSVNDNAYDAISGICITVLTNQDLIRDFTPILSSLQKEALKN